MSGGESKAVFLSYASQDLEAAKRICDALRTAGVEVWFDQSELRGGDAWDARLRREERVRGARGKWDGNRTFALSGNPPSEIRNPQ